MELQKMFDEFSSDEMKKAIERLSIAVYKIAELMYNATANKDYSGGN